jgi:tetratricopeptide (TPR) repeat protein
MKQHWVKMALIALVAGFCIPGAFAQLGSIQGACKDADGKPIAAAEVAYTSLDNGRKLVLKTNGKGEYFSLGVQPGKYLVTLTKDGKKLDEVKNYQVALDQNTLDFDLKKSQAEEAKQQGMTPEQLKQVQEQHEKQLKEVTTVKTLNEKLAAAGDAAKAKDYDTAIGILTEASQIDPTRDLIWFKLADAYSGSADKQTDPAEKAKQLQSAGGDYQKAIDLAEKAQQAGGKVDTATLAAYYNNMGSAYARANNSDGAAQAYNHAAQLNPAGAGQYYFNLGAVLTNANGSNDANMRKAAIEAFDKAIAADPQRAEAYYWKATNLIGGATLQGDKMIAPPGTAEAFNKYLELQPNGPHADEAKAMLASIGAPVETTFGTKKKK